MLAFTTPAVRRFSPKLTPELTLRIRADRTARDCFVLTLQISVELCKSPAGVSAIVDAVTADVYRAVYIGICFTQYS